MPRLRTTTGLSTLALAIGIAGTGWLSTLTSDWQGPSVRPGHGRAASIPRALPHPRHSHAPVRVVQVLRPHSAVAAADGEARASEAPAIELVPLAMPGDTSQSWDELRGHLDGRVLLSVAVDGRGRVSSASVSESSGDPVLDAHALRSVRGWRFAVPADRPGGLSGNLSMRFSSHDDRVARLP